MAETTSDQDVNVALAAEGGLLNLDHMRAGVRVRHRKGGRYTIVAVAEHSETRELFVVYRDDANPLMVWARPLAMFLDPGRFSLVPTEPPPAPRRDGDALLPAGGGEVEVQAILAVRDYLTASGANTDVMRAFIGIVATWKRDRDERDALAKRAEAAEAVVAKLPRTADGVPIAPGTEVYRKGTDDTGEAVAVEMLVMRVGFRDAYLSVLDETDEDRHVSIMPAKVWSSVDAMRVAQAAAGSEVQS